MEQKEIISKDEAVTYLRQNRKKIREAFEKAGKVIKEDDSLRNIDINEFMPWIGRCVNLNNAVLTATMVSLETSDILRKVMRLMAKNEGMEPLFRIMYELFPHYTKPAPIAPVQALGVIWSGTGKDHIEVVYDSDAPEYEVTRIVHILKNYEMVRDIFERRERANMTEEQRKEFDKKRPKFFDPYLENMIKDPPIEPAKEEKK